MALAAEAAVVLGERRPSEMPCQSRTASADRPALDVAMLVIARHEASLSRQNSWEDVDMTVPLPPIDVQAGAILARRFGVACWRDALGALGCTEVLLDPSSFNDFERRENLPMYGGTSNSITKATLRYQPY